MIEFYDEGDLIQHIPTGTIAVVVEPVEGPHTLVSYGIWLCAWHVANVCLCQLAPETTGDP